MLACCRRLTQPEGSEAHMDAVSRLLFEKKIEQGNLEQEQRHLDADHRTLVAAASFYGALLREKLDAASSSQPVLPRDAHRQRCLAAAFTAGLQHWGSFAEQLQAVASFTAAMIVPLTSAAKRQLTRLLSQHSK